ncbi:hypothetical protein F5I97DRAFT_976835 [Phlebopus sp. FC_14]|nr:hypothetical protein F5I97DRAFT_976835 [Phlebopus sp. FC_14]
MMMIQASPPLALGRRRAVPHRALSISSYGAVRFPPCANASDVQHDDSTPRTPKSTGRTYSNLCGAVPLHSKTSKMILMAPVTTYSRPETLDLHDMHEIGLAVPFLTAAASDNAVGTESCRRHVNLADPRALCIFCDPSERFLSATIGRVWQTHSFN